MVAHKYLPARPSQPPLAPVPHLRLPPGSARPSGWLRTELTKQLRGLNGNLPVLSDFIDEKNSGWLHPDSTASGWEEVPYWLRGYVSAAIGLRDANALSTAKRWIDGTVAAQADDGFFGPNRLRGCRDGSSSGGGRSHDLHGGGADDDDDNSADLWPHMPMMQAIRTYAEFTGDERVVPFFVRFFKYMASAGERDPRVFARRWLTYRVAETLDLILWTYNHSPAADTSEGGDSSLLLGLARAVHAGSASWLDPEHLPTQHNVNIAQGIKEPALYSLVSADPAHLGASYALYDAVMAKYGQFPGGGFAGDEHVRPGHGDPRQGFEVCGVVELMATHEILARVTGDASWADRAEELAFSSLPASLDPAGRAVHYINSANSVALPDRAVRHDQFDNGFPMRAYYSDPNRHYRCCAHNYGIGWPYYLEEMWVRRAEDGGIVANLHGPSQVEFAAESGSGPELVTITAAGDYPFGESIVYTVAVARPVAFNFYVRIPGWADTAEFCAPGGAAAVVVKGRPNTYHLAVAADGHTWRSGDALTVRFPTAARVRRWPANHGAVSVHFGPQAFSLDIPAEWRVGGGDGEEPSSSSSSSASSSSASPASAPSSASASPDWRRRELLPTGPWNYALLDERLRFIELTRSHGVHLDPFTPQTTPLSMTVHARRLPRWRADDDGVVGLLADVGESPLGEGSVEEEDVQVRLIPMGAARVRITMFPIVSEGSDSS